MRAGDALSWVLLGIVVVTTLIALVCTVWPSRKKNKQ